MSEKVRRLLRVRVHVDTVTYGDAEQVALQCGLTPENVYFASDHGCYMVQFKVHVDELDDLRPLFARPEVEKVEVERV